MLRSQLCGCCYKGLSNYSVHGELAFPTDNASCSVLFFCLWQFESCLHRLDRVSLHVAILHLWWNANHCKCKYMQLSVFSTLTCACTTCVSVSNILQIPSLTFSSHFLTTCTCRKLSTNQNLHLQMIGMRHIYSIFLNNID